MPENKVLSPIQVVLKFEEAWNNNDIDACCDLMTPDCEFHNGDALMTTEEFRAIGKEMKKAMPYSKYVLEDLIINGNITVTRYTSTCKMTGEFMGMPPTGKTAVTTIIEWDVIENGKFVKSWVATDNMSFMRQLGLM